MFFDPEFIAKVEEKPIEGLVEACKRALAAQDELDNREEWTDEEHELLWDASTFVDLIIKANEIDLDLELPEPSINIHENCSALRIYLEEVEKSLRGEATKLKINSFKRRYDNVLKSSFAYEFTQGDLERVQLLINEIRSHLSEVEHLDPGHKQRLLKRLENLQAELHKRVSDLDRFWGLVGDAGVVLGKLGKDAKPIVDRIREVAEIVWKTQARTEELPSGTDNPVLEQKTDA
ncbi:hypothetical protein [Marinobacter nitratireducens]|uniref:hypothetical protein n=1 Tax=Marinobacter nitratireducens TaxID=1137280 RepID=UPI00055F1945|nr:hypothetical protein [Marinobacter nitratireducens]